MQNLLDRTQTLCNLCRRGIYQTWRKGIHPPERDRTNSIQMDTDYSERGELVFLFQTDSFSRDFRNQHIHIRYRYNKRSVYNLSHRNFHRTKLEYFRLSRILGLRNLFLARLPLWMYKYRLTRIGSILDLFQKAQRGIGRQTDILLRMLYRIVRHKLVSYNMVCQTYSYNHYNHKDLPGVWVHHPFYNPRNVAYRNISSKLLRILRLH